MNRGNKTRRLLDWAMVVAMLLGISALPAFGQIDRGAIAGRILDASGAVVPNATVTITNKATGVAVTTDVDAAGEYQVLTLIPGIYSVKVSAAGFDSVLRDNITLHVQDHLSLDFTLKVGSVKTEIVVTGGEPILQTQTADLGTVVNEQRINDLPLNGRRYADLALLEPGVDKYYGAANPAPDRFSVSGNSELQNNFLLNGIDNNSFSENLQELSVQVVQPPPDALQEFKIQTRTYSAEFGNSAGAVVNATIKSGTNGYHGDLYEFFRNKVLDANSWINNVIGSPRGGFSQNQFGGTVGGPIMKDKLFFFGDLERFTSREGTSVQSTVPTPLMTQGNFTELNYTLNNPQVPGQSGCYAGNIIQAGCFDPVAQKLMSLVAGTATPNVPSAVAVEGTPGSWTGAPNYVYPTSIPDDVYSLDGRIDYTLSPKDQIFGSYSYRHVNRQDPRWTGNPLIGNGNFATQYRWHQQSIALGWTRTLSNSMVNDLRFGFNRDYAHSDPNGLTVGTSQAQTAIGLSGIPNGPGSAGIPPFFIGGLTTEGSAAWRPQYQISQAWNLVENLNWLKGTHSFKFGYQYLRRSDNFLDIEAPQGLILETGVITGSGQMALPDLLLGDVNLVIFTTPHVVHYFAPGHSFYAMDTWKAASKLTLTYGLRYELFAPLIDRRNQTSNFTPANGGGLITAASNASGWYDRALIHPALNNFAPRFGFAYQMMPRLVWRGGYGLFYQHENRIGSESLIQLNPPQFVDTQEVTGATSDVFQLKNGFPASIVNATAPPLYDLQIRAQDPNQRTPYVEQTSFGLEYQVASDTVVSATYVGNWGRKEQRVRDYNQPMVTGFDTGCPILQYPYANLNTVTTVDTFTGTGCASSGSHAYLETATNDGNSAYNGLELALRRRMSKGLSYSLGYTYSHGLANYRDNLTAGQLPQNSYNYGAEMGNSVFDIRSRFVGNFLWELPFGQGKHFMSGDNVAGRWLGGWQFNGIVTLQTGTPFAVTANNDGLVDGNNPVYANCIGNPYAGATTNHNLYTTTGFIINPAAFSQPGPGQFGTCAPYQFHGPGIQMWDLSLFKQFKFTERYQLQFRTEFFNAFNHPNFGNPNANIAPGSIGSFGKVSNTLAPILGTDSGGPGDPREIQFALKFYF
ncbi:MAG: carboxypeptidase regulatory-like domain-containing protein [Candidatus Acidiferrales bacterium]